MRFVWIILAVYISALTYWSLSFFIFFNVALIGCILGCHHPINLNSICVHQGIISAASGFEPAAPQVQSQPHYQ